MNSKDYFEQYFKSARGYSYSKNLSSFFETTVRSRLSENKKLKILDIGAGHYSLFEDIQNLNADIMALDFSRNAILNAPKSYINYLEGNITDKIFFPTGNFDLIFDSHCLNCLINEEERETALKNIYLGLAPGGLFASELMIQPIGRFVSMPFKIIKSVFDLEQEFISHGFKILYFMISKESHFTNELEGEETICDLLQIIAQKNV